MISYVLHKISVVLYIHFFLGGRKCRHALKGQIKWDDWKEMGKKKKLNMIKPFYQNHRNKSKGRDEKYKLCGRKHCEYVFPANINKMNAC